MTAFDPGLGMELYKGSGPERVVIEFDAIRSEEASRSVWGGAQTSKPRRGGGVRVSFICRDFAPVIARILRYGSQARVVKPPTLIAMVVENLTATAQLYAAVPKRKRRT
ncbi:MAG: WYL domain-containing protein [Deltaproteobacteria bacterium]